MHMYSKNLTILTVFVIVVFIRLTILSSSITDFKFTKCVP